MWLGPLLIEIDKGTLSFELFGPRKVRWLLLLWGERTVDRDA